MTQTLSTGTQQCARRCLHGRYASAPPAPRSHQCSRGPRRSTNITREELEELLHVRDILPTGCNKLKGGVAGVINDSDLEADTRVPSSTESSPALVCMPSDAAKWPSLQEACTGWDFCSELSDNEELWQDLPEPLVTVEDLEQKEIATVTSQRSYADSVRCPSGQTVSVLPPAAGARTPRSFRKPLQRRSTQSEGGANEQVEDDEDFGYFGMPHHGWKKHHKASWSKKQQRQDEEQKARRANQRLQSKMHHTQEEGDFDN